MSTPADPEEADTGKGGALAGLRVVELANLYSGPLLGAMLADYGADVVKVEPPEGEPMRILSRTSTTPSTFTLVSRGKRMVTVDHSQAAGREVLARLTALADVVVLNQPLTVLQRMGCTYDEIAARNPAAIVINFSGWGEDGPYADRGGNGTISEAFVGLTHLYRESDGTPTLSPVLLGDHLTALSALGGVLAAIYHRTTTGGPGQYLEMPMVEAVVGPVSPQIIGFDPAASDAPARGSAGGGLRGTYRTADGRWVAATAYTASQIYRLLEAVGVEVPGGDSGGRPDDAALRRLVEAWIAEHDLSTVVAAFAEARIPVTPVNDVRSLLADEHVRARGSILELEHPRFGTVHLPRPAPRLTATPSAVRWIDHDQGSDTDQVLREWLGVGADELDRLRAEQAFG